MRRIRNSQSFRIKEERALRSPHVVEMYKRETPRYQKIANEFEKARQRNLTTQNRSQDRQTPSSRHGLTSP